jgi:sec-independent protein translocase protein TatC
MSSLFNDRDASEDLFADTRMSFGDHIEELRWHLLRAIIGAGLIILLIFILDGIGYGLKSLGLTGDWELGAGKPVMDFIAHPVELELTNVYQRRMRKVLGPADPANKENKEIDLSAIDPNDLRPMRFLVKRSVLRDAVGLPPGEADGEKSIQVELLYYPKAVVRDTIPLNIQLIHPPLLSALSVTECFLIYMKVCLVMGIVLASPWIFWQLWAFVGAGLYPHEKKYVYIYLPFSLFLAGVVLCETVVIPAALHYLIGFSEWMNVGPDLRLSEWLSFAVLTPVVFGIAFQTPLVMLFLHKLGIMDVAAFRKHRRLAWFVLAIVAALLAASPDAFNMLALAIPLWLLYELGILLCRYSPKTLFDFDESESEEMIEV